MLKGTFNLNERVLEESVLINEFLENNIKKKKVSIEGLVSDNNWYESYNINDLKKIVYFLSENYEEFLSIVIEDSEDLVFEYSDALKKLFIINLSETWTADITITNALNTLIRVEENEKTFEKSVLNLTNEEVAKTVVDLFEQMKYHRLRARLNVIARLQDFYKSENGLPNIWKEYKNVAQLKSLFSNANIKEDSLTKRNLLNLSRVMSNNQDIVIPLLIFEGVRLSKNEELDELRYLKKSDLSSDNVLTIKGRLGDTEVTERAIQLDEDVAKIIRKAISEKFITTTMHGKIRFFELNNTDYIVQPSLFGKKKTNNAESDSISFRGSYGRVSLCKEALESVMYDIPFSPKTIEKFGKIYSVNRLINEGFTLQEALRETLKRFGDWNDIPEELSDIERRKISALNHQLVSRLKELWEVHR